MKDIWDKCIQRAERLAVESEGAKELLTFYGKLLRVQKEIYERLRSREEWLPSGMLEEDLTVVRAMMPMLLREVVSSGPAALCEEAQTLLRADEAALDEMLRRISET